MEELVSNIKIRFTSINVPGNKLYENILYTLQNVNKVDSNTINMKIKNFNMADAISTTNVTIQIMPYFSINLSSDGTQDLNIENIEHLSQERNQPRLFTLNNCNTGIIPYIFLPSNDSKELKDNSAFYISFSHRILNTNYYELILYPQDTQAFIEIEKVNICLSGRLNKVIETSTFIGGNTEETDTRTPEEIAAETARTAANTARDAANTARIEASTARSEAINLLQTAQTDEEKDAAEAARVAADAAQVDAEVAALNADEAEAQATEAERVAEKVRNQAERAAEKSRIEAAKAAQLKKLLMMNEQELMLLNKDLQTLKKLLLRLIIS